MARRDDRLVWVLGGGFVLWLMSDADWFGPRGRATGSRPTGTTPGGGLREKKGGGPKGVPFIDVPMKPRKISTIPGTVSASPELEPRHGRTPEGYDSSTARALAQGVAAHLTTKGPRAYDHARLARFQRAAGIRSDGTYGGSTRGALVHYGARNAPRPFVAPFATLPYSAPDR